MSEYSVLRTSPPRIDAIDKVTGRARFSADIILPRMLHGKVLRSPLAHARIKRLDTSRAKALPGVKAVVTAADVPGLAGSGEVPYGMIPCVARDKVVFVGQTIAAVAAVDPDIAAEALELIDIDYEELPAAVEVIAAMQPEAPVIYPGIHIEDLPGNIFWHVENKRGDIETGFQKADIVLENTFRTQTVHQGHLEPRASVADISPDGRITVWSDNQGIFRVRELTANFLKLPLSYIRVMPVEVGGTFGGKEHQQLAPLCALLAQKTGRPVKMVMTREEVFQATRPAAASVTTIKAGVSKEGLLTALSARVIFDFGASTGMPGWDKMLGGVFRVCSMYRIPDFKIAIYDVVTNKAPSGPYRAPSAAQITFALESEMDLLSRELKMDPLEFRLKNAVAEGDLMADGSHYPRIGFKETLEKMQGYLAQQPKSDSENRGRGIACGVWHTGSMGTGANIHINADGSLVLVLGSTDVSGSRTTLAQMVAEEFGIPLSAVRVVLGDTETAPFATIAAGSITTRSAGTAVYRACQDAKDKLIQRAAVQMNVKPEALELVHGQVRMIGMPEKFSSMVDLVRERFGFPGFGPILGQGAGENQGRGTPVFVVESAEVEVDKETGKVRVLSFAAAQDTGLALNPRILEGQIQGAAVQGIGWALSENYVLQKGKMINSTFQDYRMPTAADVPFIDAMLVEVNSRVEPYGIRGAGEPPIVPALAAVANAVHSATGVRFKELPLTPEIVLQGIKPSAAR